MIYNDGRQHQKRINQGDLNESAENWYLQNTLACDSITNETNKNPRYVRTMRGFSSKKRKVSMNAQIIPHSGDPRQPSVFRFGDHNIRVITIDDSPWFVAADVCKALDVSNPTKAIERLDADEYTLTSIQGSPNQINVISESGLFSLILTSRKDEAKQFKKWVTSEVLPTIRKTGSYTTPTRDLTPTEALLVTVQRMVENERALAEHEKRIVHLEAHAEAYQKGADYFTVMGYSILLKLKPPIAFSEAQRLGVRASKLSRDRGVRIDQTRDPRFGMINMYHTSILDEVLKARNGGGHE
jgi:prophage antirepressor-like protein